MIDLDALVLQVMDDPVTEADPKVVADTLELVGAFKTLRSSVYFVLGAGRIKIGKAENVQKRLAALQSSCPVPLTLLATVPGNTYLESQLHRIFADVRDHGEWFLPSPELLLVIRRIQDAELHCPQCPQLRNVA